MSARERPVIRASEIPRRRVWLREPGKTLVRYCGSCRADVGVRLPSHPAGLGRCTRCGALLDLADNDRAEVAVYLAQYDHEEAP